MLAYTYFNDISIETYKRDRLMTFMLAYSVYITSPLI